LGKELDLISGLVIGPNEWRGLAHKHIEDLSDPKKRGSGVLSGSANLDKLLNPLKDAQMRVVMSRPGCGKCLGRGTRVVMYNGVLKNVEDIRNGDLLMGVDSMPRRVHGTTRGVGQLYTIKQNKGIDYTVNDAHILMFKRKKNEGSKKHGEIRQFTAQDFYERQSTISDRWSGYSTGVEFPEQELLIDPYFLGVWLGDGSKDSPTISKPDSEMYDEICRISGLSGWTVSIRNTGDKCFTYGVKHLEWRSDNSPLSLLRRLGLIDNKHIPVSYLVNSRENRLRLLAGLMDTDGHLSNGINYEFSQKSKRIMDDVCFLANSLGFRLTYAEKIVNGEVYYRGHLTGAIYEIPCVIPRKKAEYFEIRNDHHTTGVSIEDAGIGEYFGFELDGDGLFLLEDFTVTHNTSYMMQQTREAAKDWYISGDMTRTPPVFISAEMAIEEIVLREVSNYIPIDSMLLERGEVDTWDNVHKAVDEIAERRPIIFVGHSLDIGRKRPRISVENIRMCLQSIQDQWGARPTLVSVDYAQRLKLDKATRDRRGEVSEIVESIKDMALEFATPFNLGSQVGRQVDERKPPIPTLADAKETSNLEETADSILAFMRPSRYYKVGEKIPGSDMECHENLFFVSVLKQRQGKVGNCWLWFDMAISRLSDIEIERIDLNDWGN